LLANCDIMAHVYSTAVAILYGASDNCQNEVQKPTISQINCVSKKPDPYYVLK